MPRIARHRTLRLAGWIAAYALALQAMLFAFATATNVLSGPSGIAAAMELCLGGGSAGDADGDPSHALRDHCVACFAATADAAPPQPQASPVRYADTAVAVPRPSPAAPRAADRARPGLPRAPPSLA